MSQAEGVGEWGREELEKRDWFRLGYRATSYEGVAELEALRGSASRSAQLDQWVIWVFLGEWCPDSRLQVPGFFKLLDQAGWPREQVRIIHLGRDKRYLPWTDRYRIERVPTFVFEREGRELGRIVERPRGSLLEDAAEFIGAGGKPAQASKENA